MVEFYRDVMHLETEWDGGCFTGVNVAAGATPISFPETYPYGLHSGFVADPEGNLVELVSGVND